MLAVGAGVGEECLFRGLLQSGLISRLEGWGATSGALSQGGATALGLGTASLVFGALHAVTPAYFTFATVAGGIFGEEACAAGSADPICWLAALCLPAVNDNTDWDAEVRGASQARQRAVCFILAQPRR